MTLIIITTIIIIIRPVVKSALWKTHCFVLIPKHVLALIVPSFAFYFTMSFTGFAADLIEEREVFTACHIRAVVLLLVCLWCVLNIM